MIQSFFLLFLPFYSFASYNILDFGAIPNNSSDNVSAINSQAIQSAFSKANLDTDRTVLVPAGYNFYIFNIAIIGLNNITFQIDGNLTINNNITYWEQVIVNFNAAVFYVAKCTNFNLQGNGLIDGQGHDWWWYVVLGGFDNRPFLFLYEQVNYGNILYLRVQDSPFWHFNLYDVANLYINGVHIHVDVESQLSMLRTNGLLDETTIPGTSVPIFPLNTDGFDPAGINITIENCTIESFDDAIAVKPLTQKNILSKCSQNMIFRNLIVNLGVGLTIGSVPPDENVNCVRNITFENSISHVPIKGIYVKTNPGTVGSGIIDSITYRNLRMTGSLWYPIWIGPQQQHQPHENGTGCSFFYPIVPQCPTQPLVSISNIILSNVTFEEGLLLPGVILCDPVTVCKGFVFDQVVNLGINGSFLIQQDYVCENVLGTHSRTVPDPGCF